MLALLSLALLVSVALAVPATLLVFTVPAHRHRVAVPTTRLAGVVAGLVVAVSALAVGAAAGAGPAQALVVAAVLGATVSAWRRAGVGWDLRGLVAWALSIDAGLLYLAYVVVWTVESGLGAPGTAASGVLWLIEAFVFLVGVGYLWEFVDVLSRRAWDGYVDPDRLPAGRTRHRPFVSLHVPIHHEPPDLVIETLRTLVALESTRSRCWSSTTTPPTPRCGDPSRRSAPTSHG